MVRKTKLMLEVERKIGKDLEAYLKEEYETKSAKEIGRNLGTSITFILKLLDLYSIDRISLSERKLPKGVMKPKKEELDRLYNQEKKSIPFIANQLGAGVTTIARWLKNDGIETRKGTYSQLPDVIKPSKEKLEIMYLQQRMSTSEIAKEVGAGEGAVQSWLKRYGIPLRTVSEVYSLKGFVPPAKEELIKMYFYDELSISEIGRRLNVSNTTISNYLKKYDIKIKDGKISSKSQFMEFMNQDEGAKNLVATAYSLNGQRIDMEKIIMEVYEGKFKDINKLHELIEESEREIRGIIEQGVTNLSSYIGEYGIKDRKIIPILVGQVVNNIPKEKIGAPLEEILIRILRFNYGPLFNENPKETLKDIQVKINSYEGKKKEVYQKLFDYYEDVLDISRRLN